MRKIKILQYVSCMNRAGAETLLMNIYRNINREKYEFHFISHTKDKCDYDEEIKALGGKIIYLERPSLKNLKKYESDFQKIVIENGPYVAIHSHMQLMNGFILKTAKEVGIKNRISHAHLNGDYSKGNIARECYRKYSKYLIEKNSTENLACSKDSGKYLYDGREFTLLNNAIDLNKYDLGNRYDRYLNKEFNLDNDVKIITHIGRFVEAKNHKFIIKVFSELIKENKNYRLMLCGEGPLKKDIESLVRELNLQQYVYFLGVRTDINRILLGTDVYFMPSILEGLPVSLVEAQAAGCSCIVSDDIPRESDMGIGIIRYQSLNDSYKSWVKNIVKYNNKKNDFKLIKKCINEKRYNLENNIKLLMNLYT